MVMQSKSLRTRSNRRGIELGSQTPYLDSNRRTPPPYTEALKILLADGVVFAHKLRASDWSVEHERILDLRELFQGLGRAVGRMNVQLSARAGNPGLVGPQPELADAFGRTRLTGTAPRGPVFDRAEDTLSDIRYLNAGLRVAALLAERAGEDQAAHELLDSANELEGFGWVIAAWLN